MPNTFMDGPLSSTRNDLNYLYHLIIDGNDENAYMICVS